MSRLTEFLKATLVGGLRFRVPLVLFVPAVRIRPLGIDIHEAMKLVKRMGMGSAEALKGVDFAPTREA